MAFGTNYAERSRKMDLITQIRCSRVCWMTRQEAIDSTRGYRNKTVAKLETIAREAYSKYKNLTERN